MTKEITVIPNASVQLEGTVNHLEGTTDQNGVLTLNRLPPDTYTLMIVKEGYKTYIHNEPITILENKNSHTKLHVSLTKNSRTIQVKVTPKTSNIEVSLTSEGENTTPLTTKTDTDGVAVFNNVLYGTYLLTINKTGYEEYAQNVTVNKTNNDPRVIEITLHEVSDD